MQDAGLKKRAWVDPHKGADIQSFQRRASGDVDVKADLRKTNLWIHFAKARPQDRGGSPKMICVEGKRAKTRFWPELESTAHDSEKEGL